MRKTIFSLVLVSFLISNINIPLLRAGEVVVPIMPKPGTMVSLSPIFTPAYLKGIVIHPDNALQFDFLINKGDGNLNTQEKNQEYTKLVKYFLAALTVPDQDQWVNLSPYEKDRIIKDDFGKTEMGRDLLGQDYLLKQITSSLMYPESGLGKNFWDKVYAKAQEEFGNTNIPVNTFNKVWIVPDQAIVYESGNIAYVGRSHLKVMLEEDYLAINKNKSVGEDLVSSRHAGPIQDRPLQNTDQAQIIRELILPELEKEVNQGKNFAQLRQVFSGMILATWYKKALKESLLAKIYADKNKTKGTGYTKSILNRSQPGKQPNDIELVYQQYLQAFKKGVYNYIKEDTDKYTHQPIPRKYFAGGVNGIPKNVLEVRQGTSPAMTAEVNTLDAAQVSLDSKKADAAMNIQEIQSYSQWVVRILTTGVPLTFTTVSAQAAQFQEFVSTYPWLATGSAIGLTAATWFGYYLWSMFHTLKGMGRAYDQKIVSKEQFRAWLDEYLPTQSDAILIGLLNHRQMAVREKSAEILVRLKTRRASQEEVIQALLGRLGDYDPVHQRALLGLKELGVSQELLLSEYHVIVWNADNSTFMRLGGDSERSSFESVNKAIKFFSEIGEQGRDELVAIGKNHPSEGVRKRAGEIVSRIVWDYGTWGSTYTLDDVEMAIKMLGRMGSVGLYELSRIKGEDLDRRVIEMAKNQIDAAMGENLSYKGKDFEISSQGLLIGTIYSIYFLLRERAIASKHPTIAFDLDGTIAFWNGSEYLIRPGIEEQIRKLKQRGFRIVLWTSAPREHVRVNFIEKNSAIANFFDLVISRESFSPLIENEQAMKGVYARFMKIPVSDFMERIHRTYFATNNDWGFKDFLLLGYKFLVDDTPLKILKGQPYPLIQEYKMRYMQAGFFYTNSQGVSLGDDYPIGNLADTIQEKIEQADKSFGGGTDVDVAGNVLDAAMKDPGGIDMNSANLDLQIKRDGKGVPLPLSQQDMALLSRIEGFVPRIIAIKPASSLPIFSKIQ